MYTDDLKRMAEVSTKKVEYFLKAPGGYFLLSALAGIYLGLGICLIFSVGAPFAAEGSAALKDKRLIKVKIRRKKRKIPAISFRMENFRNCLFLEFPAILTLQ